MNEKRVCLDPSCSEYAGEFHYPSILVPRYSPNYQITEQSFRDKNLEYYDDDSNSPTIRQFGVTIGSRFGNRLTVGRRLCKIRILNGITDIAMMLLVMGVLLVLGFVQNKEAEKIDLSEQTAQDYRFDTLLNMPSFKLSL